ncbi:MAG: hydroxyacid dehydrogenase [Flavobacteriales bacterium]|jgi:D-3-phosphoglycerate dehydrogenase / 2-oxoglutarate reductase|nr:hydroxyacid dehydrogenase [Flavobacteriales bacterium]|tara:strand:- start:957 stop:1892 length:936 start_codon:yes stop_codon:yes gene_type:complete
MKALLLDDTHPFLEQELQEGGLLLVREFQAPLEELVKSHSDAVVLIIRSRMKVDCNFLDQFPLLKVIGRLGAGLENIDVREATQRGISCLRVPEGNARAVAEHALGMLLSLLNHLPRVHRQIQEGQWLREPNKGRELQSLVVGIIGYGIMGSEFAKLLSAMNVRVLAYDKYKSNYTPDGIEEVTLDVLQSQADVVSLHLPLNDETNGYVEAHFLSKFKKPVHFINTARGPIVDTAALVEALDIGTVLSAALDVLEYEKTSFTSLFEGQIPNELKSLFQRDNVLLSPHIAGWTKESFEKMGQGLASKVLKAL